MKTCLDTHGVIWSLMDDPRLGRRAKELVSTTSRGDIVVSDIVLLETAILFSKGRLREYPLEDLLAKIAENFRIVPITPEIAQTAAELKLPHGDPFDRTIVATAKVHGVPLLTRDRAIKAAKVVKTIW